MSTTAPEEPLAFDLVDRLHKSLRVGNIDRNDMAAHLGIHRNTIGKYLRGEALPSRRTLIAWALRCPPPVTLRWLLTGEEDGPGGDGGLPMTQSRCTARALVKPARHLALLPAA